MQCAEEYNQWHTATLNNMRRVAHPAIILLCSVWTEHQIIIIIFLPTSPSTRIPHSEAFLPNKGVFNASCPVEEDHIGSLSRLSFTYKTNKVHIIIIRPDTTPLKSWVIYTFNPLFSCLRGQYVVKRMSASAITKKIFDFKLL